MESFAVDTIDCPLPPQGLLDFEFAEGVSRYARKASASQHSQGVCPCPPWSVFCPVFSCSSALPSSVVACTVAFAIAKLNPVGEQVRGTRLLLRRPLGSLPGPAVVHPRFASHRP